MNSGRKEPVLNNKKENDQEEEMNLKNVLLLNPQNDEAIFMLIILNIKPIRICSKYRATIPLKNNTSIRVSTTICNKILT